jgi:hypothetical protein
LKTNIPRNETAHDTLTWKLGMSRAVSFLGIHKSDLVCSVVLSFQHPIFSDFSGWRAAANARQIQVLGGMGRERGGGVEMRKKR